MACARSCKTSSVRAPMPRGGKLTTRRNAPSSCRRRQQTQVGERVLDLGTLEEAHAAIDPVRHPRIEQRVLDHARLRVGSIEHRDLGERDALVGEPLHDVDDERRLVDVGWRGEGAHRLARCIRGPQVLAQPALVVLDQRVGRVEDVAVRAVVLLELDELDRRGPAARSRARSAACWRRSRRETRRSTGRRRRPRTARRAGPRAAAATCTAARWCPGIRRPGCARSDAGSARAGCRGATAARSCAAAARESRPRLRAGTPARRARSARPGGA